MGVKQSIPAVYEDGVFKPLEPVYGVTAHAQVTGHAAAYIRRYGQLTFTELTRYEVLRGLIAAQASRQLTAFESFCRLHRILPFDAEAARRSAGTWADLRARGQPIGEVDTMIAGIALAHGLAVVSQT